MPEAEETIAQCHSCGSRMNVAAVAPFSNVACPKCGEHTRVKREFGPYTLVRRHAVGGMSMVFAAHDTTLDREVALKILSEEYSSDERRVAAFEEEARITASFSHPHVVRVFTTGKAFGRLYIAMEMVPGGHFEHQIRERGQITELEMLPLAIEVAEGLRAAHAAGLIHRDVKPGNILLDAEGHAKLVDFGLALVTKGGKAKAAELWATPYYVPPETIEGYPEDFRSDIYAFGATLYHALAGVPSCGEETMATDVLREAKRKVVPLGTAEPSLSVDTCRIVERAMAYQPDDRFSSYDELIGKLESALKRLSSGAAGATESSGSAAERRARRKRGERIAVSAAALVLISAAAGGTWWVTREKPVPPLVNPALVSSAPIIPESTSAAATDIAKSYREARAAVEARDFDIAAAGFVALRENPSVQEPTRTWAGVEAVVALYLAGEPAKARVEAAATAAHVGGLPEEAKLDPILLKMLKRLGQLPVIPPGEIDPTLSGAPRVMARMLAGLKNWEQGMLPAAAGWFDAVASATVPPEEDWLAGYQALARDYQEDFRALSGPLFGAFPADPAGCEAAVASLETVLAGLKTRGRARFNVRAWQLDIARHAKLMADPPPIAGSPDVAQSPPSESGGILAKVADFASQCRFSDASEFLKSIPDEQLPGFRVASLLAATEASAIFLADLEDDLARGPVDGAFEMKSGEPFTRISIDPDGAIMVTGADGEPRGSTWAEISPDSIIGLHRTLVKNPRSELERLRRHECAIAFDWLAGNRERALIAASTLSDSSPAFKLRWQAIAAGLPAQSDFK